MAVKSDLEAHEDSTSILDDVKRSSLLIAPMVALPLLLHATPLDKELTTLRKGAYRFEIETASRKGDWFGWWGASNDAPKSTDTIVSVRAYRAGTRLLSPLSAFAGLAASHSFALRQTKRGMEMRIVGGDAGESWRGTFLFNGPGIVERTIQSGEFPEVNYERTTFRYIKDGEVD